MEKVFVGRTSFEEKTHLQVDFMKADVFFSYEKNREDPIFMLWDNFESFLFTQKLCVDWVGDTIIYNDQVLVAQGFWVLPLTRLLWTSTNLKRMHAFLRK